jgi:hypothetical protein
MLKCRISGGGGWRATEEARTKPLTRTNIQTFYQATLTRSPAHPLTRSMQRREFAGELAEHVALDLPGRGFGE